MKRLFITFFLVVLSLFNINAFAADNQDYIAIVDAGSSGSRMHVYGYTQAADGIPTLNEIYVQKIKPGISSYVNDPEDAGAALAPIIQGAADAIKAAGGNVSATKIYILATAGMRELTPTQQDAIYQNIQATLSNYDFQVGAVRTIPGWKEGVYDWLTVNKLENTLQYDDPTKTNGVMDLGGASTQIAFHSNIQTEDTHNFMIGAHQYSIFSHSFLNLGQDQALARLPNFGDVSYCYPNGFDYGTGIGKFDEQQCESITNREVDSFAIPSIVPPLVDSKQYDALSGFYYGFSFFNAGSDVEALRTAINNTCNADWETLQKEYPDVPAKYLSKYCFDGNLILSLLGPNGGYNLDDKEKLNVTSNINGTDVDWPVGAAVYLIAGQGLE